MGWGIKASEKQVLILGFLFFKHFMKVSILGLVAFMFFRISMLIHCNVLTVILNNLHSMVLILLKDNNASLKKTGGRYFTSHSILAYSQNHIGHEYAKL